ncbi:UDP-3-O-acyl-N-acetylglucosamine deacetylase [Rhodococcus xishaensis]|uniref:UDP-3-O-acyl-N-acetylglucosamine deacetylase n=1 Tax=Rhodococcus xishaensis TaxID=2487364 RepID=UPI0013E288AC|nr:UDP-3-O-acyl-N-acetylglucosamine deacetylase [Rhodococcus xishaensis]
MTTNATRTQAAVGTAKKTRPQTTLKKEIALEGIGIHTGEASCLTLKPAAADSGYVCIRTDLEGKPRIPARLDMVTATVRSTNVGREDVEVHTVEHVLSALNGLDVDNAEILVDGPEPPVVDGASLGFAEAIRKAGVVEIEGSALERLTLAAPVESASGDIAYRAAPIDDPEALEIKVVYSHERSFIGTQTLELSLTNENYLSQIAPARTFSFEYEIEHLHAHGLAKGGSFENAVVIADDDSIANPEGLRFEDEFVRHKALDLIGDLALLGRSLRGLRIEAVRGGHHMNVAFARRLEEIQAKR